MAAPIGVQTNVASLNAQNNIRVTSRNLGQSIERLSSGLRINSAADDAAGVAVAAGLNSTIRGFKQAQRNANDGIAMLQTAEGSYQTISDILTRMRELAVQSSNDSLGSNERLFVDTEYQALTAEIDRVATVTEYNGIKLLDGDPAAGGAALLTFQIGTRNTLSDQAAVSLDPQDVATLFAGAGAGDVLELANAQTAIEEIDNAMVVLSTARASLGANINQLTSAVDNLGNTVENLSAAKSQIQDADVTHESSAFTKNQVLMQAGVAMLAQANAQPNLALRLIG